jgi:hypothetical protein
MAHEHVTTRAEKDVEKVEGAIIKYLEDKGRATLGDLRHHIFRDTINAALINLINEGRIDIVIINKKRYYAKRRS